MATAYIETTIPSYYTSRPARDVVQLTRQTHTKIWWDSGCSGFELFTSQETINEASRGDTDIAAKRLELLSIVSVLEITSRVEELTKRLLSAGLVPANVASDAIHIATASVHGMDFLVTLSTSPIPIFKLPSAKKSLPLASVYLYYAPQKNS